MNEFFTIPDLDLSQESSVDPMGLQVIWTAYGQDIFGEKINTIANDLRVFTFNLFHNNLINSLFQDNTDEIQNAKSYYKEWKTEFDLKAGLLIFLEDLVTHVFYNNQKNASNVEVVGILGMSKARMLYSSTNQDQIFLAANKRLGLLKNQLNLGMTGRYKGSMINMQFFDRSLTYLPDAWKQVNRFMLKWTSAMNLQKQLIKLITVYLFSSKNREYPQLSLQQIKSNPIWKSISEGYLKCFGSGKLSKDIKEYWRDRLGLSSGAPAALFKEISKLSERDSINHLQIFMNAKKHLVNESGELNKLDIIIALEPFLSHSEYLLRYLSQPGIKTLKQEEKHIELLRKEIITSANFTIENTQQRLKDLRAIMLTKSSTTDWLRGVIEYHKKVMNQRGGNAWVEIDNKNNIKHFFAPTLSDNLNTISKYLTERPWFHTYYLETLRSINRGLI